MAGQARLAVVEGTEWQALVDGLRAGIERGEHRALGRQLKAMGVDEPGALQDLAALPVRACSAVDEDAVLSMERCTAGRGCPVQGECPLVRSTPDDMACSALARGLRAAIERCEIADVSAPVETLDELGRAIERLLEASGRVSPDSPPRARTSLAVLDMARRRGGVAGVTGPFLTASELEQVAAFVPPSSGATEPDLAGVEGWLRQVVCFERALAEVD